MILWASQQTVIVHTSYFKFLLVFLFSFPLVMKSQDKHFICIFVTTKLHLIWLFNIEKYIKLEEYIYLEIKIRGSFCKIIHILVLIIELHFIKYGRINDIVLVKQYWDTSAWKQLFGHDYFF